jgi:hypothetical protein
MPCVSRELTAMLQSSDCLRIRRALVRSDRCWWPVAHRGGRFAQEAMGCARIPSVQEHEVDQHANRYFHLPPTLTYVSSTRQEVEP